MFDAVLVRHARLEHQEKEQGSGRRPSVSVYVFGEIPVLKPDGGEGEDDRRREPSRPAAPARSGIASEPVSRKQTVHHLHLGADVERCLRRVPVRPSSRAARIS